MVTTADLVILLNGKTNAASSDKDHTERGGGSESPSPE